MDIVIEGKITIDNIQSEFDVSTDEGWNQWGASLERLCESQPIVEAIARALFEQ